MDVKPECCSEAKPSEAAAAAAASEVQASDAAKDDTGTCEQESATASTNTSQEEATD